MVKETADPLPVFGWKDFEFEMTYDFFGTTFHRSVLFIDVDAKQQIFTTVVAEESNFAKVHAAAMDVMRSWCPVPARLLIVTDCRPVARQPSRPEEPVAGVAEAGDDVATLIEACIDSGGEDRNVGLRLVEVGNTGGTTDEIQEAQPLGAGLTQTLPPPRRRCDLWRASGPAG